MPTKKFSSIVSVIDTLLPYSWAILWFMLIFSLKLSLFALYIFALLAIIRSIFRKPSVSRMQLLWLIMPVMLFIWYLISYLIHYPADQGWDAIEKKISLLAIPVIMMLVIKHEAINVKWAMRGFIAALIISGAHLLGRLLFLALSGKADGGWAYHAFTEPYHLGAIYYSWYLGIAILYLITKPEDTLLQPLQKYLLIIFIALLMISASKLFIVLIIPLVIWKLLSTPNYIKGRIWLSVAAAALLFLASIPFLQRIDELGNGNLDVVIQEEYTYDTPLNGLTLRLIQWKFGIEILNDQDAWLTGNGPGNSQALLDGKYLDHGLYTGSQESGDNGYLGYNFHSQYIETLVATGIPGILILVTIIVFIIAGYKKMSNFPLSVLLVTIFFFFTESVLERQAGIVLFCLLICPINKDTHQKEISLNNSA